MPKYIVTAAHGLGGGRFAEEGEIVELDPKTAAERIRWGFIKPCTDADGMGESATAPAGKGKAKGKAKGKTQA